MKKLLIIRVTAALCVASALIILTPLIYVSLQQKRMIAHAQSIGQQTTIPAQAPPPQPTAISGHPEHLTIPNLELSLVIADGTYNSAKGEWSLSWDKVHYAVPTSLPNNESGNTLIYGHYKKDLFLNLPKLAPGSEAYVDTANGHRFVYVFEKREVVAPNDTALFNYEGTPRLTLQTCTGRFMENRQFFYFRLDRVEAL